LQSSSDREGRARRLDQFAPGRQIPCVRTNPDGLLDIPRKPPCVIQSPREHLPGDTRQADENPRVLEVVVGKEEDVRGFANQGNQVGNLAPHDGDRSGEVLVKAGKEFAVSFEGGCPVGRAFLDVRRGEHELPHGVPRVRWGGRLLFGLTGHGALDVQ
jgi:hypothetical protein